MAKHKKKKAPQAPEPEGPPAQAPPKKPETALTDSETARYKAQLNILFWLRVGLALAAGTAATVIFEPFEGEERRWVSISFMIIIFICTIIAGKMMRMRLPSSERKKLITQGIGSYVFLYLFMWIVSYTLANISSTGELPLITP